MSALSVLAVDAAAATAAPAECATIHTRGIDKQQNLHASEILVKCGVAQGGFVPKRPAAPSTMAPGLSLPGSDINLITGTETYPSITQSESFSWSHGSTIVVNYNDSRGAPGNYSGLSVSHDGGATFTRLGTSSPLTGHGSNNFGDPNVVFNEKLGTWFAGDLVAGGGAGTCGAQGIGLWTSPDGDTWTVGACAHTGGNDDRQSMWVDNNASSPFFGRMYVSWNDFNASGALKVTHSDNGTTWSAPVTLLASFQRNVQLTGSPGPDGTVFSVALNENGGGVGNTGQQNVMYRSTDGGVTWSPTTMGGTFTIPGNTLCAGSGYFPKIGPIWRQTGYGTPAVGPGGVVHYVYAAHGAGTDEGDVFYVRSTDNGATWSAPVRLNTDSSGKEQWMPSLRVTPSGIVEASWYDRRNTTDGTNYERFARISSDNGATWGADQAISSVLIPQPAQPDTNVQACYAGDYNYTTATANIGFDTWTDGRVPISPVGPQQDVFFHQIPLVLPAAAVGAPGTITATTALLNGAINPGGQQSTWKVQYGTTPGLGSETGPTAAGNGTSAVPVSTTLTGLTPHAKYYYRFVATNDSGGSGFSAVQTFTAGAPDLTGLSVSPKKVSIAGRKVGGKCVKTTKSNKANPKCKRPIKQKVSYSLNGFATVKFTIKRLGPGRKVKGKCVKPTKKNNKRKHCTRLIGVGGNITQAGAFGSNSFTFKGKIGGKKLGPGRYELTATPTAGGLSGVARKVKFRIVGG